MSDKSDVPVSSLTRIAFAKEKLSFVPRAAKAGSEPETADIARSPIGRFPIPATSNPDLVQ